MENHVLTGSYWFRFFDENRSKGPLSYLVDLSYHTFYEPILSVQLSGSTRYLLVYPFL